MYFDNILCAGLRRHNVRDVCRQCSFVMEVREREVESRIYCVWTKIRHLLISQLFHTSVLVSYLKVFAGAIAPEQL